MIARIRNIACLLVICLLGAVLGGCGSSSGNPAAVSPAVTRLVSGTVEDGPIAGSKVTLLDRTSREPVWGCGESGQGLCSQIFDNPDGHFAFLLSLDVDPARLLVEAVGGVDQGTRLDFSRTGFAATPLRLLSDLSVYTAGTSVTVSPLTTLWVQTGDLLSPDIDPSLRLATALGQSAGFDPFVSSATQLQNQRLTLLLSELAIHSGLEQPFAALAQLIIAGENLIDPTGQLNQPVLTALLTAEQLTELQGGFDTWQEATDSRSMFDALQEFELLQGLLAVLTGPDAAVVVDPTDPVLRTNLQTLAEKIRLACGDELLLGGLVPEHLASYALYAYGLEDATRLTSSPSEFNSYLTRLDAGRSIALQADPTLADLATLQVIRPINVPLPIGQLLSGDGLVLSDQKRDYYYNSDVSHLYRAKQLVWNLADDQVRDAVLVQVTAGEALAGRFAEARTLAESQIYQSEARGQAYLELADGLTAYGLGDEALAALQQAESLFRKVVEAKGVASFANQDADHFKELARGYAEAGYPLEALAVLQYLTDDVADFLSTTSAYGKLTSTGFYVVEAFAELGDLANAETALDQTYQLALGMPNDSNGTSKSKVQVLVEVLSHSADLGDTNRAWTVWDVITTLRYAGGVLTDTGTATYAYMPGLVVAIYSVGGASEAFGLIDELPGGTGVLESYHNGAIKKLATYMALRDGLGAKSGSVPASWQEYTAFDLIMYGLQADFYNPTPTDAQIEALTYFSASLTYVAQAFINQSRFDEARDALQRAETLVESLDDNSVKLFRYNSKINYGYAKLAGLYLQLGDLDEARRMLVRGRYEVLPNITSATPHANAVAALADLALDLGDLVAANDLLAQIGQTVGLDGYRRTIEAFIRLGDYPSALTLIADYADVAEASYDPVTMDNTSLGAAAVSSLVRAANFYSLLGDYAAAVATLQRALPAGWDIPEADTRMARLTDIAEGYALARADDLAEELAWSLPYQNSRDAALQAIATRLATRDDFPDSIIATVDLDGDGQPDFFSPEATAADVAASGLQLDLDSDQDGVPDTEDRWPFSSALPSQQ